MQSRPGFEVVYAPVLEFLSFETLSIPATVIKATEWCVATVGSCFLLLSRRHDVVIGAPNWQTDNSSNTAVDVNWEPRVNYTGRLRHVCRWSLCCHSERELGSVITNCRIWPTIEVGYHRLCIVYTNASVWFGTLTCGMGGTYTGLYV